MNHEEKINLLNNNTKWINIVARDLFKSYPFNNKIELSDVYNELYLTVYNMLDNYNPKKMALSNYIKQYASKEATRVLYRNNLNYTLSYNSIQIVRTYLSMNKSMDRNEVIKELKSKYPNVSLEGIQLAIDSYSQDGRSIQEDEIAYNKVDISDKIDTINLYKKFNNFGKYLDKRELEMIKLHYGLGYNEPMTLREIGKIYGCSYENVRRLINRGCIKLRDRYENSKMIGVISNEKRQERKNRKIKGFVNSRGFKNR